MSRKNGSEDAVDRDRRGWDQSEARDQEPVEAADSSDPDAEVSVTVDEDLDDIDAPIDPDFGAVESWEFEALDLDDSEDDDDQGHHEADDDEAEMLLLQELGIDLDAPDPEAGLDDLAVHIDYEDPVDDSVAA